MDWQSVEPIVGMFGVIGVVVLVAALLSGALERTRMPQILVFLVLGTLLGPFGLGIVDLRLESETIRVVATLSLVLVLFSDAVSVRFADLRHHARLAAIILGPGTLLVALAVGAAAYYLLGFGIPESAILGAALASTDPVILRGLLRDPDTPTPARYALRIESGMNDAVLLPIILVAVAALPTTGAEREATGWSRVVIEIVLLGGGAGIVVGLAAIGAFELMRRRFGIRRDYESLYVLGVALTAFAAAEAIGGSGFIAAFTAGLTIAALDLEMCECFYDYGEASAEMALLFTFVALGSAALWRGLAVIDARALAFAAVALFARTLILALALTPARLDARSRWITVWFGPRGLSSLLLVLVPVFAGARGSERLFEVTALVVLFSLVIHGGSQVFLRRAAPNGAEAQPEPAPRPALAEQGSAAAEASPVRDDLRITLDEYDELRRRGEPVILLDVRTVAAFDGDPVLAEGALRMPPDTAVFDVQRRDLPRNDWLVAYCA